MVCTKQGEAGTESSQGLPDVTKSDEDTKGLDHVLWWTPPCLYHAQWMFIYSMSSVLIIINICPSSSLLHVPHHALLIPHESLVKPYWDGVEPLPLPHFLGRRPKKFDYFLEIIVQMGKKSKTLSFCTKGSQDLHFPSDLGELPPLIWYLHPEFPNSSPTLPVYYWASIGLVTSNFAHDRISLPGQTSYILTACSHQTGQGTLSVTGIVHRHTPFWQSVHGCDFFITSFLPSVFSSTTFLMS